MLRTFTQNKIFLVGGVLVVLGIAWYMLSSGGSTAPANLSAIDEAGGGDQELLQSLQILQSIKLEPAVFSNPVFLSLKDFSTQIIPEPVGRLDPFAPISASAVSAVPSSSGAKLFR